MLSTLAEFLPGLLCVCLLLGMLAIVLLAVGTSRGWGEREWRRARLALLLLALWGVACAVRSASPSLLMGLVVLFWAEQPVEPGERPAPWRQKLAMAGAGTVAFLGLALLRLLLAEPTLAPSWRALAAVPFLAYGGVSGVLLRRGLHDWRRQRSEGAFWKLRPALVLLAILGVLLAGLWKSASRQFWWLIHRGPASTIALLRPVDSWLGGPVWLAMQWLDLLALIVLSLWLFQHLWERLVIGGENAARPVDALEK